MRNINILMFCGIQVFRKWQLASN